MDDGKLVVRPSARRGFCRRQLASAASCINPRVSRCSGDGGMVPVGAMNMGSMKISLIK